MEIGLVFSRRAFAAVSLVLAILLHPALGLPAKHPLRSAVDKINESGPYVALLTADFEESNALWSSGEFIPSTNFPSVDLYGRTFHIGSVRGVNVINVVSGERRLNAGNTVQILSDVFNVRGIVHYGSAGGANDSISAGDVSVPKYVAFTGAWTWTKLNSETEKGNILTFGKYNVPAVGVNLLASVVFEPEQLFVDGKPLANVFWLQIDSEWYQIAEQLKVELQRCLDKDFCLPEEPQLVFGQKASTSDVYVNNAAYRQFLFNEFGASTVDEESAAVVQTATASGVPVIVFRGVSNLAGGEETETSSFAGDLASINSLKAVVAFIATLGKGGTFSSS